MLYSLKGGLNSTFTSACLCLKIQDTKTYLTSAIQPTLILAIHLRLALRWIYTYYFDTQNVTQLINESISFVCLQSYYFRKLDIYNSVCVPNIYTIVFAPVSRNMYIIILQTLKTESSLDANFVIPGGNVDHVKFRSRGIRVYTFSIVLKFDRHLGSNAAEMPANL